MHVIQISFGIFNALAIAQASYRVGEWSQNLKEIQNSWLEMKLSNLSLRHFSLKYDLTWNFIGRFASKWRTFEVRQIHNSKMAKGNGTVTNKPPGFRLSFQN